MNSQEIMNELAIHEIQSTLIHVQECNCKGQGAGTGLQDGFEWLTQKICAMNLAKPVARDNSNNV